MQIKYLQPVEHQGCTCGRFVMHMHSRLDASPAVIECVPECLCNEQKLRINK